MLGSGMVRGMRRARHQRAGVESHVRTSAGLLGKPTVHSSIRRCRRGGTRRGARAPVSARRCCSRYDVLDAALPGIATGTPIVDHTTAFFHSASRNEASACAPPASSFIHALRCSWGRRWRSIRPESCFHPATPRRSHAFHPRSPSSMCSDLRYLGERDEAAAIYKLMGQCDDSRRNAGGINDVLRIAEERGFNARAGLRTLRVCYDPSGQIRQGGAGVW